MELNPNWLAAPIAIPLIAAAIGLPFTRWGYRNAARWQRRFAILGVLANLAVAILILAYTLDGNRLVLQMGQWQAPFGIVLVADALTGTMLTLSAILATATVFLCHGHPGSALAA